MRKAFALGVARAMVQLRALKGALSDTGRLSFHRVEPADLDAVGAFRLRHYLETESEYLLDHLDERGLDDLDQRSFVYAARVGDRVVGTVRAVPPPFELDLHVPRHRLQAAVGANLDRYLEVSRMLVTPELAGRGLGSAMIGFGGLDLLLHTSYRGYLAYIRDAAPGRAAPSMLPGSKEVLRFQIEARGTHDYTVVAGAIGLDALWRGVGRVRAAAGRHHRVAVAENAC